jgi:uncharacterized protein YdaU (DUF1376 family)
VKSDAWMPFYMADYLRKTMHLSREQHGAYLLLIMAAWDGGGRLRNDPLLLAGIVKASASEWRRLAPILMPFFAVDGDFIVQARVQKEHEKAARISETRRGTGALGGRPRKPKTPDPEKPIGSSLQPQKVNQTDKQTETHASVAQHSPTELKAPQEAFNISAGQPSADRPDGSASSGQDPWAGPESVWTAFAEALGEPWCEKFLRACRWQDVPDRALIPPHPTIGAKMLKDCRPLLAKLGLQLLEKAA